jgi:hypothetical protein
MCITMPKDITVGIDLIAYGSIIATQLSPVATPHGVPQLPCRSEGMTEAAPCAGFGATVGSRGGRLNQAGRGLSHGPEEARTATRRPPCPFQHGGHADAVSYPWPGSKDRGAE